MDKISWLYPILGYLIGSVPFGLILSNIFGNANLRKAGSKNIGATNVFRTQGKILGFFTFFLDFIKGLIPCYFFQTDNEVINLLNIAAPVLGHIFPIWLKFKGGKGIATYFGVLCALNFSVLLVTLLIWAIVYFLTKTSSLAGLSSIIFSCFIFSCVKYFMNLDFFNQLCVLITIVAIIISKHRENIRRLLNNEELKT